MDKNFLTEIQISDFKCFDDFKADGFKRVNLIGGKNNVGKTAFMEACYVNVHAQDIYSFVYSLVDIKFTREALNILANKLINNKDIDRKKFLELNNNIFIKSNINNSSYKIKENDGIKKYIFEFKDNHIEINVNEFSLETYMLLNVRFIDNFGLSNSNIKELYSSIQKKDKEQFLNDILKEFDPQIESFKIIDDKPQCKVKDDYIEITEFGDGVRHLVSIVVSLFRTENGYLFIDEIDNGIHYIQLDNLWKIILTVSKELNCQIFATTHSKECIESYYRVAKKLEDEDITYVRMTRLKSNKINASVHNYGLIENSLEQDHEVRGW
ncbi:AAA family ATPase [Thiotrichales bacterium HSG1]|nr:AAA family ATPase [Thiotrichales bacterium HSG1]